MRTAILFSPIWLLMLTHAHGQAEEMVIDNGYFRLSVENSRITSLQVDSAGNGHYGTNWLLDMGFEGFAETKETRVTRAPNRLQIHGLSAEDDERIEIKNRGVPVMLKLGHTLGQSFEVKRGTINRLEVQLPTWNTKDSGATLSLLREGPHGELIVKRKLQNVRDNSWQELLFKPQKLGIYYVELSEPKGQIGWWCSRNRKYKHGQAYADGQPISNMERSLRIYGKRTLGEAEFQIDLEGARLKLVGRVKLLRGEGTHSWPLLMKVRWDNTGYDVSARSVPFYRFFTNTMRYMPTHQLKRWKERNGWYELSFRGCKWIEADGTGNYDLRFNGHRLGLSWHLVNKETTLRLSTSPSKNETAFVNQLVVEALPRDDTLPADWPEFVLPNQRETKDTNTFFYERAFTYQAVWGPAAWHEWNALGRLWQGGVHLETLRRYLEDYPISEDGYVHTWGNNLGWPFPDNKRYDTRHFDTNARFILACWRYAAWTGDMDFLQRQAERLRKAMHYQLAVLHGQEGLIITASKDVNGRHKGVGDNYWDILPFGHLDAYANIYWYASLEAMAQVEEMLATPETVKTASLVHSPDFYRSLARKVQSAYNSTFWNEEKGRYIGCIDIDGKKHDYGFTFVNMEAMAYGLADQEKARRIYHWMETELTSTGKSDTYTAWIFAPRANTIHNPRWNPREGKLDDVPQEPWWHFGWHGTAYGDQCQDGGAILYTSFYDLMARCRLISPDNAWQRWQEILDRWRMPDHLCGGPPLYRGEHPQQINPGAVGLDIPFPESSLVQCWLLYGLLGVEVTNRGLEVSPRLPKVVPWLEVRNVAYHGILLNIRGDAKEVAIECKTPGYEFTWRRELGSNGKVIFTHPPKPVEFPEQPVWEQATVWHAQWIWLNDSEAPKAFFRYKFELPMGSKQAWLSITADNSFILYINGEQVAAGNNWSVLYHVNLTHHLHKGSNTIAVAVNNVSGPGGLIAEGEVIEFNGNKRRVFTSRRWRVSAKVQPGWLRVDFDDTHWLSPREYGRPPCSPWQDIGIPSQPQ